MLFKGKTALITGGSRGIGRAITLKLAAEGADVIINHLRKRDAAAATAEEARKLGVKAHVIRANIAEVEKIDRLFDEIEAEFGKLDIFVSNAASGTARAAMDLDERGWDWTMDINARAFLLGAQRAARLMKRGGHMVSISSLGSQLVLPVYTAVGVSKAALESLTRYLAVELAPRGINVNAVSAGAVQSDNLMMYGQDLPVQSLTETPVGRMVLGEDIANLVAFLCSDNAHMIRGQVIVIDGGLSLSMLGAPTKPPKGEQVDQS
jgi:enoyl-[acyl-carrier protein] reductase III